MGISISVCLPCPPDRCSASNGHYPFCLEHLSRACVHPDTEIPLFIFRQQSIILSADKFGFLFVLFKSIDIPKLPCYNEITYLGKF